LTLNLYCVQPGDIKLSVIYANFLKIKFDLFKELSYIFFCLSSYEEKKKHLQVVLAAKCSL